MVDVTNIEVLSDEDNCKLLKVFYTYLGSENTTIKIFAKDSIFKTTIFWSANDVEPNGKYWTVITTKSNTICNTYFSLGIDLSIKNRNDDILFSDTYNFILTDFKKRTLNNFTSISNKNFWIIGDSHVGFIFDNIDKNELVFDNVTINKISHLELSLNRFLKSDWQSFFKSIPIKNGDSISILLGEIDLRYSIIKNSRLKKVSHTHTLQKILTGYSQFLEKLKTIYPNCDIVVLCPNYPIKDNVVNRPDLFDSNEEKRKILWTFFNNYFENELLLNNINHYWNCHAEYVDDDGYMKKNMLIPNDIHVNNGIFFIQNIKRMIQSNLI